MTTGFPAIPDTAEWRTFLALPAAYAHPVHLAACFRGSFDAVFCEKLATAERLHGRLSALLIKHYDLPEWIEKETCDDIDRAVAASSVTQINELALRAGAIFWAANIATAILAHEVDAYHKQLGRDLCTFALTNRDLGGPKQENATDDMRSQVLGDGWRCLEAWRVSLPVSIAKRVLLKLAPDPLRDTPPSRTFVALGPAIVRRAANLGGANG